MASTLASSAVPTPEVIVKRMESLVRAPTLYTFSFELLSFFYETAEIQLSHFDELSFEVSDNNQWTFLAGKIPIDKKYSKRSSSGSSLRWCGSFCVVTSLDGGLPASVPISANLLKAKSTKDKKKEAKKVKENLKKGNGIKSWWRRSRQSDIPNATLSERRRGDDRPASPNSDISRESLSMEDPLLVDYHSIDIQGSVRLKRFGTVAIPLVLAKDVDFPRRLKAGTAIATLTVQLTPIQARAVRVAEADTDSSPAPSQATASQRLSQCSASLNGVYSTSGSSTVVSSATPSPAFSSSGRSGEYSVNGATQTQDLTRSSHVDVSIQTTALQDDLEEQKFGTMKGFDAVGTDSTTSIPNHATESHLPRDDSKGSEASVPTADEVNKFPGNALSVPIAPPLPHPPSPRSLDLSSNKLNAASITSLCTFLSTNSTITQLHLSSCTLGTTGAVELSQALQTRPISLQELRVSRNDIGDFGARALGRAIRENNRDLEVLSVGCNEIAPLGMKSLLENACEGVKGLRVLEIYDNAMMEVGALALARSVDRWRGTLERLDVGQCLMSVRGCLAVIGAMDTDPGMQNLASIALHGNGMEVRCLEMLLGALEGHMRALRDCSVDYYVDKAEVDVIEAMEELLGSRDGQLLLVSEDFDDDQSLTEIHEEDETEADDEGSAFWDVGEDDA
ncbi:hypothetical protein BJ742DRAFT_802187 [Cladochytrium replicatum]|nr:hypothetical protein BJ742DRAFT_802187 [Cladochytrium replicatum]